MLFVRPAELRCDSWQEFDLGAASWRSPSERMKMRRTHIVTMSRQALTIVRELKKFSGNGQHLFPSSRTETRPISDATMLNALRCMGYHKHEMGVHGYPQLPPHLSTNLAITATGLNASLRMEIVMPFALPVTMTDIFKNENT
ncbi:MULTISPECIES: hypothetical protein [unclassified Desulfovibrio]|uniref:tyrosine-type recombinase/integrase n=1 Tax=unclassified Desulfovibrio TaxID=2593640 RepID=UPI0013EA539B|nr:MULTISPECIES: hypothetical protein [unclassified Desulfovibrio]